jgi:hypothetical protein
MIAPRHLPALVAASALLLVSFAAPSSAEACTLGGPGVFHTEDGPSPDDVALPKKPTLSLELVKRGQGPESAGGGTQSRSTCDDLGWVIVGVAPYDDSIGYEFELVDGHLPREHFSLADKPVTLEAAGEITMSWSDGDQDQQEAIDFALVAHPVDKWGRRGPASDPLRISHPGSDEAACSVAANGLGTSATTPGPVSLFVSTGLLVIAGLVRRRTPRSS